MRIRKKCKLKTKGKNKDLEIKPRHVSWKTIAITLYIIFLLLSMIAFTADQVIEQNMKESYKYHLTYPQDGRQSHYYVERVNTSFVGKVDLTYTTASNSLVVDTQNIKVLHIYCRSMYEDECKNVFGFDPADNSNYYKWYFIEKNHLNVNIDAEHEIEELSFIDTPIPYKVIVNGMTWTEGKDYFYTDNFSTVLSNVPARHSTVDIYFKSDIGIPPIAILKANKKIVAINQTIDFDASGSFDTDGDIITYLMDFGDGTLRSGSKITHKYSKPGVYGVILLVRDNDYLVDHDYLNITVVDSTDIPEIQGQIPNQIKPEDSPPWSLNLSRFEPVPSSDNIEFNWYITGENTALYSVVGENSTDDYIFFTPVPDAFGNDLVSLWLHNTENLSVSQPLWINITPVNDPPSILPLPDLIVHYDEPYTFNYGPYVSDKETPWYELTLEINDGLNENYVTISELNATFNYPHSMLGDYIYATITISDSEDIAQDVISIQVTSDYVPKLTRKLPDAWLFEGTTKYNIFDLDDYFMDPDNDAIYFSYGFTHLEIVIHPNHTVDISAVSEWTGTEFVTFRAHDPIGAIAEDSIIIKVLPVNDPPTISGVPNFYIRYDHEYRFELTPYVHDNDNLTSELWIITSDPQHIRLGVRNKLVIIMNYSIDYLDQSIPVRLMVTDGLDFGFQNIIVNVTEDFPPELISPIPDIVFLEDEPRLDAFDLDHYFLDVDGDTLYYTSGNRYIKIKINSDHTVDFSAPKDWFGAELVYFRATDPIGALQQDLVLVTVLPVNDAPVLLPIPPQYGNESMRWTLELEAYIFDVDNNLSELEIFVDNEFILVSGNTLIFFGSPELPKQVEVTVSDGEYYISQVIDIHLNVAKPLKAPTLWDLLVIILPFMIIIILIILAIAGFVYQKKTRFSVEEIFLIHKGGILISHLVRRSQANVDDIIFSGMFTAVQEFIKDAFTDENGQTEGAPDAWALDELKLGENNILIERSKHTYLAVIFSGEGSKRLRRIVNRLLDKIELKYSEVLPTWDGNLNKLKDTKKILSVLIKFKEESGQSYGKSTRISEKMVRPKSILHERELPASVQSKPIVSKPLVMARLPQKVPNLPIGQTAWPLVHSHTGLRKLSGKEIANLPIALHTHPRQILPKTIVIDKGRIKLDRTSGQKTAPACLEPSNMKKKIKISMSEGKDIEIDPSRSILQQLAEFEDEE